MTWYKNLPYPLVFLIFLVAAFFIVDYIKELMKDSMPELPSLLIVVIGFGIILVILKLFKVKLPFWG